MASLLAYFHSRVKQSQEVRERERERMKVYLVLIEVAIDSRKWNSLWSRSKLSFFLLCLFSIQRYFFIACFTFRRIRDYDSTRCARTFGHRIYIRNMKWTDPYRTLAFSVLRYVDRYCGARNELRITSWSSIDRNECFDRTLHNECVG